MKNKDYLAELYIKYGANTPIIIEDLTEKAEDYDRIRQYLSRKVKEGKLCRAAYGVYYFPTQTILGNTVLSTEDICQKKFIGTDDNPFGYYSGLRFWNELGISTQMANVIEITTNNTAPRKRNVLVGDEQVILRRPRTTINKKNAKSLQLLDMITEVPEYILKKHKKEIKTYIDSQIIPEKLTDYLSYYPAKTYKKIVEAQLGHVLL